MLLSRHYEGGQAHYHVRCKDGHEWEVLGQHLVSGRWCAKCMTTERAARIRLPDGLKQLQKIARDRGGKCLEHVYLGQKSSHRFRCARGHEWSSEARNVTSGHWCAKCAVLDRAAPTPRPDGLERLQHKAQEQGGVCLSSTYSNTRSRYRFRCAKGHEWETKGSLVLRGHWCPVCGYKVRHVGIETMREIAQSRGGMCLSKDYAGCLHKLEFQCKAGHRWLASPTIIQRGHWCPQCRNDKHKLGIAAMRELAAARGGQCLSTHYKSAREKLEWLCHKGHAWWAVPHSIKRGRWCPECARLNMVSNRKNLSTRIRTGAILGPADQ